MALSGSFYKDVGTRHQLRGEWTATQDVGKNQSTVTLKTYWIAKDQYGAIYSSDNKSGSSTIEGTTDSFSLTAALNGNQKRLMQTQTKTITHNDDGTFPDLDLSVYFDPDITFSGQHYGPTTASGSWPLNTIPRKSTLAVSANFTAARDKTMSIDRASSSFRHEIEIYVKDRSGTNVHVKHMELSAGDTSQSTSFSDANIKEIYNLLDGRSSTGTYVILQTYKGTDWIGSNYYDGTMTSLDASYPISPSSFNIGGSFDAQAAYYDRRFTHVFRLKNGSTTLKSYTLGPRASGQDAIVAFDTASIASTLYNLTPNSNSMNLTLEITTSWDGEIVKSARSKTITAKVTNSNPAFAGAPTYADINSTTTAITGNNQQIISKKSNVRVTLSSAAKANPKNGASMVRYTAALGGETIAKSWSSTADVIFDFGTISPNSNQTLVIRAVDSRGNNVSVTKGISVIPYDPPGISVSAERINGFEEDTVVKLSGTLAELKIGTTSKNALVSSQLRTKLTSSTAWGTWSDFPVTGFPSFTATDRVLQLDNLNSYDVQVQVTDKLGTTTVTRTVIAGKPIWHIDELLSSVGFGDFPSLPNEMLINGRLRFGATKWAGDASQGEGATGAIDLNNSDIVGMNGIYMSDVANNTGEGWMWLRPGRTPGSTDIADYEQLYVYNGSLRLNDKYIAHEDQGMDELWEGVYYMKGNQIAVPTKPLSQCPTGWILVWCEYVNGAASNAGWTYTHVPKHDYTHGGALWIPASGAYGNPVKKYVYIGDTNISGHDQNTDAPNNQVVLRYVLSY